MKKTQTQNVPNINMPNIKKKAWAMQTNFGKDHCDGTVYYNKFLKEKYLEYYRELIDYLKDVIVIVPNDYHFKGMYYESTTHSFEEMYIMSVHNDDSVSFDYFNKCVNFDTIRVKMKDIFKIFKSKGNALTFILYCMKCFSTAAK